MNKHLIIDVVNIHKLLRKVTTMTVRDGSTDVDQATTGSRDGLKMSLLDSIKSEFLSFDMSGEK